MELIKAYEIGKSYHQEQVLDSISFRVQKGTVCTLLGENGAGKSTLLNILMGTEVPDCGNAIVLGSSIKEDMTEIKARLGFVTEKISYNLPVTIDKMAEYYQSFYGSWNSTIFKVLADAVGLETNRPFLQYSRGQKMQIALIFALAVEPELVFIDEVTSVLDVNARKIFIDYLKEYCGRGGTVVITTNIVHEIQHITDQVILLKNGRIHLDSDIKDIPKKFSKIRTQSTGDHPIFADELCLWTGINSDGSSSFVVPNELLKKYDEKSLEYDRRATTLDEVFIYFNKVEGATHA